ncbi:hypothetical protein ACFV5J_22205 [Streptomyces zaomyceticus]|uniref:hypothetical protein n=1 Tax=Streptomyces zaomyceticus TaxID=68286 RepID=UPI003666BE3B
MLMSRGSLDDIPWTALYPGLTAGDVDVLSRVARAVDRARGDDAAAEWEWAREHVVDPVPRPWTSVVLGVDVRQDAGAGDQLEFLLQLVRTDEGRLAVEAAVNVACWCDTDHGTHDVDALTSPAGDAASLRQGFAQGAERLIGWLADPRDADHWRARAALPSRRRHGSGDHVRP